MFSNKNKKVENLREKAKTLLKLDYKFKSNNNKINKFENSKSSQDYSDKSNLIRNNNNKNNNKRFSKITNNNSSSYFQNKSITTSNSERKYRKKLGQIYNTYSKDISKNHFLIKQINKKLFNGNNKKIKYDFKIKAKEKNQKMNYILSKDLDEDEMNLKQKEKLKQLKYLIFNFDRKQKTIEKNHNNIIINLEKRKKINFCREKKLNTFVPCISYDKNNIFTNKKISAKDRNTSQKKSQDIANSFEECFFRTNYKRQNNKYLTATSRTETTNRNKKNLRKCIPNININNLFLTEAQNINNKSDLYKKNNSLTNHYYHLSNISKENFLFYKKRCKSSHDPNKYSILNISNILKEKYNKALFPLTQRLITESNIISDEISNERKVEKLFDYFGEEEMKKVQIEKKNKPIDLKKIRKDNNLYNINTHINETNIVYKGIKRIEKLLTCKKEVKIARNAAQRVINEDLLSNNYFDYDDTYNIKLQKLIERRLYSKFVGDTMIKKRHMKTKKKEKSDGQKLFKLLKGSMENFFDRKSLKYLIFKYKAIKLNNGKKF